MKKYFLLVLVSIVTTLSFAQCSANFSWTATGNTVQFNNSSAGTTNYDWTFGDGTYSNQMNPNHTYSAPGTYNACLYTYYLDSIGNYCGDSICQQVTVVDSSGTGCSVNAMVVDSAGYIYGINTSTGASSYSWTVTDYNTGAWVHSSTSYQLNYYPGYSGDFLVCLTAFQANGNVCDTVCDVVTIIDSSGVGCSISANIYSSNGQIIGNNSTTGASWYTWSVYDSNTGSYIYNTSTQNLNYSPGYSGNFWVCLSAFEANGMMCDSLCGAVTVIDSSGTGCSVGATILDSVGYIVGINTSSGATTYSWTVTDYNSGAWVHSSTSPDIYYSPGYSGDFWVCLTAYQANGNVCDTICDVVTIIDSSGTGCSIGANIYASNGQIIGNNTTTGASSYSWTVYDVNSSSLVFNTASQNLNYTPGYNSTFYVCLTAFEVNGNQCDSLCDVVTVIDSSGTGCSVGATIVDSAGYIVGINTSSGATTYSWTVTDYNTGAWVHSSTSPDIYYSPGYSGDFWVCLTAYQANGNVCDTICDLVTIIDSSGTGCSIGANIYASNGQIIGNNTTTGASSYSWTVYDVNSSSLVFNTASQNLNYTPGYNSTFYVCLTAFEANGNQCDSLCDVVTVIDSTGTGCSIGASIYSSNGQIIGNNSTTGASSYSWTVYDSNTGSYVYGTSAQNLYYSPGYSGNFWVCLTAFEANGNQCDSLCDVVTVVDSTGTGCSVNAFMADSMGYIVGFNYSTGASYYSWTVTDNTTGAWLYNSTSSNIYFTPGYNGDFHVCLTAFDASGNVCDTVCNVVTISNFPSSGCSINASIYGQSGEIIGVNNSTGASSFEWTVYDVSSWSAINTTTTTDLNYTPGYYGDFYVCLNAFDSTGYMCDSICTFLTLTDSLDSTAGVINISLDDFRLYPNPASTVINIEFNQLPSNSHALIVDMLGREMLKVDLANQITEIHVADFPKGVYLVHFLDINNRIIGTSRFVRE